MNSRVFSVILLPTSECNVACDYRFEHKEPHRLSSVLVPLLTRRLLDPAWSKNLACRYTLCTGTGRSPAWPLELF